MAKLLLASKADPATATTDRGVTPLHIAASNGDADVAQLLATALLAAVDASNDGTIAPRRLDDGATPLLEAAEGGHRLVVETLLAAAHKTGARGLAHLSAARTATGVAPLHAAAAAGHASVVDLILNACSEESGCSSDVIAAIVNQATAAADGGATPLAMACKRGNTAVVERLLGNAAAGKLIEVNKGTADNGATPLYLAAQGQHSETVGVLLAAKVVDVNQPTTDSASASPLDAAVASGTASNSSARQLAIVGALLDAHADPNQRKAGGAGVAPLFVAAQEGLLDVLNLLLNAGSNPNVSTAEANATPLFVAAMQGHVDVAAALLARNADPNSTTADIGATPLFMASQQGHTAVATLLLNAGAKIGCALTNNGATELWASPNPPQQPGICSKTLVDCFGPNHQRPLGAVPCFC